MSLLSLNDPSLRPVKTSWRALFGPFLIAALIICIVEGSVYIWGKQDLYGANFFEQSPFKDETKSSKRIIYEKLFLLGLGNRKADIFQVGDSSGFFGVQPKLVEAQLDGLTYTNLSCCGDTGWAGYLAIARTARHLNPDAKAMVLHVTPYLLPGVRQFNERNPLAEALENTLAGPWRHIFLPSMNYRPAFSNWVETGAFQLKERVPFEYRPAPYAPRYKSTTDSLGWWPVGEEASLDNMRSIATQICDYSEGLYERAWLGLSERKTLYLWLSRIADFARGENLKLAIVFAPVPCQRGDGRFISEIEAEIAKFQSDYPDVYIPHSVTLTYQPEQMADLWHLRADASDNYSEVLGQELAQWLNHGASSPYKPVVNYSTPRPKLVETVLGPYLRLTPEPTRCLVTLSACPEHPTMAKRFEDVFDPNSGTNADRCAARAKEFANWCKATKPVTATFLKGRTVLRRTKFVPAK